jgi:hypothetical protein
MSLIDSLQTKALEAINDPARQNEWVTRGYDAAVDKIAGLLPPGQDASTPLTSEQRELQALRQTLLFDLGKLEKHKPVLVGLGEHGLRSTISLLGLGNVDNAAKHAARVALKASASWGQVGEAILTTAEAGNQQKRDLDKKIEELKVVLKDLGTFAAARLLPFLIALI